MMNIIAYSGGKDSTALLCWAKDQGMKFTAVFCDTGWEHPGTYKYVAEINKCLLDGKLVTLQPKNYDGMADLVQKKKRVPSARARFCTQELKIFPMADYLKTLDDGEITVYQGIRADESVRRAMMPKREWDDFFDAYVERPLLDWSAKDCFDLMEKHLIPPNPLYLKGCKRVGCFPCVMISHRELKNLTSSMPEVWSRIDHLEQLSGRSFFPPNYIPNRFHSGFDLKSQKSFPTAEDVKNYLDDSDQLRLWPEDPSTCMSVYNLCE